MSSSAQVVGDARRLSQALSKLIANALKLTPRQGQVRVELHVVEEWIEVDITDAGRGLAPDVLESLLNPAHRVHETGGLAVQGSGLSLAIVRGIIEGHGGTLSARANPAAGTIFSIRLPAA